MDPKSEALRLLDQLQFVVEHDTYHLNRDRQSQLEWRINDLRQQITQMYEVKNLAALSEQSET